jgi:Cu2+-exporting ATPase
MWAFGYNLVAVGLAMVGLLRPVLAAAVMAGSSIVVMLNSLRLERLPDPSPMSEQHSVAEAQRTPAPRSAAVPAIIQRG